MASNSQSSIRRYLPSWGRKSTDHSTAKPAADSAYTVMPAQTPRRTHDSRAATEETVADTAYTSPGGIRAEPDSSLAPTGTQLASWSSSDSAHEPQSDMYQEGSYCPTPPPRDDTDPVYNDTDRNSARSGSTDYATREFFKRIPRHRSAQPTKGILKQSTWKPQSTGVPGNDQPEGTVGEDLTRS